MTKHLFDNRYGTGQSTVDGIIRARECPAGGPHDGHFGLQLVLPGSPCAPRAWVRTGGPLKALEAVMDGFRVVPMIEAAPIGDSSSRPQGHQCD